MRPERRAERRHPGGEGPQQCAAPHGVSGPRPRRESMRPAARRAPLMRNPRGNDQTAEGCFPLGCSAQGGARASGQISVRTRPPCRKATAQRQRDGDGSRKTGTAPDGGRNGAAAVRGRGRCPGARRWRRDREREDKGEMEDEREKTAAGPAPRRRADGGGSGPGRRGGTRKPGTAPERERDSADNRKTGTTPDGRRAGDGPGTPGGKAAPWR